MEVNNLKYTKYEIIEAHSVIWIFYIKGFHPNRAAEIQVLSPRHLAGHM